MTSRLLTSLVIVATGIHALPTPLAANDEKRTKEKPIAQFLFEPVDEARSRAVPVKVYARAKKKHAAAAAPVVLFSHGLGGSRMNSRYLGNHWAEAGYVAVFMQHIGSDESIWIDLPPDERREALTRGASGPSYVQRGGDVKFVLDQLEKWNTEEGHPLFGRLDLEHIGMSGHSFGAVTAQGVMGQRVGSREPFFEPRLDAFVLMSPSPPKTGTPEAAYGHVEAPILCMTGTKDESQVRAHVTPESRQSVFPALKEGDKYQVVFDGGHHFIFSDRDLRDQQRDPRYHPAILRLTTAFWDAYLKDDAKAKAWLQSDEAREVLDEADIWEWK